MSAYDDHRILEKEFIERLGYFNRQKLPDDLVRKIAEFCDAHHDDSMTAYYAISLINKFYRNRTKGGWLALFASLDSYLQRKKFLIEIFFGYRLGDVTLMFVNGFSATSIWQAIDDFEDGYDKANLINRFARLFTEDIVQLAYQRAWSMSAIYKVRALAGIYSRVDALSKDVIFKFLCEEFVKGNSEAAYQLKRIFPYLDANRRTELVNIYLGQPNLPEYLVAYFIIRNVTYLNGESAQKCVDRTRKFQSEYFVNRCLLKLGNHLPEGELEMLYRRFIESFVSQEPSSQRIHNLYHFSAALNNLDRDSVIDMALEKIASFDDSQNRYYDQDKYKELCFIVPLLNGKHRGKAFLIAESVRGGYKKNIISKLRRHFSSGANYCLYRYPAICY
jgi:hypothetical protein